MINTTETSVWTSNSPTYNPYNTSNLTAYYDTFGLVVQIGSIYAIGTESEIDTYGCLYYGTFTPANPTLNQIICDDDAGHNNQFRFQTYLQPHIEYTLLTTPLNGKAMGPYKVIVSGMARVNLFRTTLIDTTEITPTVTNTYNTTGNRKSYHL